MQKGKGVTNLTGEKLYEFHVMDAVHAIRTSLSHDDVDFYVMLADPLMSYNTRLYLEHPALDFFVGLQTGATYGAGIIVEFQAKRAE